jgi:Tol biopolymer transport system component/predicted Ser/Thr protein kinase
MDAARWGRIEALYHATAGLGSEERAAYLTVHCDGDAELRREVEVLLGQSDGSFGISSYGLQVGQELGPYRIEGLLGAGGMGQVYTARDSRLDRPVAIKVVREEFAERFKREASAISALNHPNICTLYDVGPNYLVMELVQGETLAARLKRGRPALRETLHYARQIAGALAAAHERGIVHRDLKPENIMLTGEEQVKLLDFGLAKQHREKTAPDEATLTQAVTEAGTILGTVAYMSPEQAQGQKVDARSDIFSFGSVLYEMLSGRAAFRGESKLGTLTAILREEPAPLRDIPAELDRLVARCLRKDPAMRWQHMADLRVALEELRPAALGAVSGRRRLFLWGVPVLAAAGVAAWSFWPKAAAPPVAVSPPATIPLTSAPGIETQPALSPDGKQVVYVSNAGGANFDLYVTLVGSPGNALRLTTDPGVDRSPVWSPDGSKIAFCRNYSVYVISALGGAERKLVDLTAGREPVTTLGGLARTISLAWSPDGKVLAATDRQSDRSATGIALIDVATGEKRGLTTSSPSNYGDYHYSFSPDGKRLAFGRHRTSDVADLYIVGIAGGEPVRVTTNLVNPGSVVWSPWSDEIYYSATGVIYQVAAQPGAKPRRVLGDAGGFAISASGRLVFGRGRGDSNLWEQNSGETAAHKVASSTRYDGAPQYSPDGSRLAFLSGRGGPQREIWVSNRNGANARPVTDQGGVPASPRWSPDGKSLVFASWDAARTNRDVYLVPVEGGVPRRLTADAVEEGRPSFSRDGNWVYFFSHRTGRSEVWKMPAAGGEAIQISRTGGHEARESVDGATVYFVALDVPGLKAVPVGGGEEREVVAGVRAGGWDVNRHGVAYFGDRNERGRPILLWNPATGRTKQVALVTGEVAIAGTTVLAATRDGDAYLWQQFDDLDIDLLTIENIKPGR